MHLAWSRAERRVVLGWRPGGAPSCTRQEASAASLPKSTDLHSAGGWAERQVVLGRRRAQRASQKHGAPWARDRLGRRVKSEPAGFGIPATKPNPAVELGWWIGPPTCTRHGAGRSAELYSAGGELASLPTTPHSSKHLILNQSIIQPTKPTPAVELGWWIGAPSCTRQEASAASLPTTPHSSQHLILNQSITKPQIHPDSHSNSNKPSTQLHPISVSIYG